MLLRKAQTCSTPALWTVDRSRFVGECCLLFLYISLLLWKYLNIHRSRKNNGMSPQSTHDPAPMLVYIRPSVLHSLTNPRPVLDYLKTNPRHCIISSIYGSESAPITIIICNRINKNSVIP